MKKIITVLLICFAIQGYAQEKYSIINFIDGNSKLFLNNAQLGTTANNTNLRFKMYSEGSVYVVLLVDDGQKSAVLEIKNGNTYYFHIKQGKLIDEKEAAPIMAKIKKTMTVEENLMTPIGELPSADEGPKQGTCFLINSQGYLITNYHVINKAKSVKIKGIDNDFSTLYGVDVVAYDIDLDLALLKLKNKNIKIESIPYSISLETAPQGTKSFVLGYPLTTAMGEEIKITEGIISAKSGYKGTISQYQFSAAIQPGNSGSPLFDDNGNIIGVINAKLQGAEGAGYAIKSQYLSTFIKLVDNVQIENGKSSAQPSSLSEKASKFKNFIFIVITE